MKKMLLLAVICLIGCEDAIGWGVMGVAGGGAWVGGSAIGKKLAKRDWDACQKKADLQEKCACLKDVPDTKETPTPKECKEPETP